MGNWCEIWFILMERHEKENRIEKNPNRILNSNIFKMTIHCCFGLDASKRGILSDSFLIAELLVCFCFSDVKQQQLLVGHVWFLAAFSCNPHHRFICHTISNPSITTVMGLGQIKVRSLPAAPSGRPWRGALAFVRRRRLKVRGSTEDEETKPLQLNGPRQFGAFLSESFDLQKKTQLVGILCNSQKA